MRFAILLPLLLPLLSVAGSSVAAHMATLSSRRNSRSKSSTPIHPQIQRPSHPTTALPLYREAPAFRNGLACISPLHTPDSDDLCDPFSVNIAMTLDFRYLRGSTAAILSIVQHAACPQNVVFHFLASATQTDLSEYLFHHIRSTFPYLRFKVYHFDENLIAGRISSSVRDDLEQPLNYARIYIAHLLPACVGRVIYLDSDVVVVDDIAELWGISLGNHTLAAPEYCHANFTKYFTDNFWLDGTLSSIFNGRNPCYFNTGVMVMDLERWRHNNFSKTIEFWMQIQRKQRIYELGSLPPFLLVFAGNVEPVEHKWNQHGLGGDTVDGRCRQVHPGPVSLLHWSGKGKPWVRLDSERPCPVDSLWAPYDLLVSLH